MWLSIFSRGIIVRGLFIGERVSGAPLLRCVGVTTKDSYCLREGFVSGGYGTNSGAQNQHAIAYEY
jgi:hypothetical protein